MKNPGTKWATLSRVPMTLIGLALCISGCDQSGEKTAIVTAPAIVVVTSGLPTSVALVPISASGCTVGLNLILTSPGSNTSVQQITLQLSDGTNIGGPMITFPQADLNARFGGTVVFAGTSQVFPLLPLVPCGSLSRQSAEAAVTIVDARGRRVMTATADLY